MNIRISLLFVFLVGLFCFSCTSKKYKLELTEHNYDRLLYLNKKERMYSFRLRDKATATINGKNYVKKVKNIMVIFFLFIVLEKMKKYFLIYIH